MGKIGTLLFTQREEDFDSIQVIKLGVQGFSANGSGVYASSSGSYRHSSFSVRELQNGTSKIAFGYRVLARRKDVEVERLARVEIPEQPAARDPSDLSPPPIRPEPIAAPDLPPGAASQASP